MIKLLLQSKLCFIVPLISFLYTPQEKPLKGTLFNNNDYKQSSLITKIANLKSINYSLIFTLCSKEIESACRHLYDQLKKQTRNPLMMLNFNRKPIHSEKRIDSEQNAPLFF
jgi:hypothetical protein